jgi:phosphatidylglycerophosphate synthase
MAQALLIAVLAVAVGLAGVGLSSTAWAVGVTCGLITNAALARGLSYYRADRLGPADWVTLTRATLVVVVAALVADSFGQPAHVGLLVSLAAAALVLDAVDGWVARRTRTAATLGARFDGEVDAFLILVLSVYVARSNGAWVLAIGATRYAFLAAEWSLPWMRAQLPPRFWRKTVAATEGIVLTIAASNLLPRTATQALLIVALALLAESFGRDVWWLWRRRLATPDRVTAAVADRPTDPTEVLPPAGDDTPVVPPVGPRRARARSGLGVVLTILAALVVWVALVAPTSRAMSR